ncbi:hypothetical protein FACS1894170_09000 [Planctomycetales bacterium]|nr:hypothetical protein FACS1894170_09000 [Planctomycetales bacterium]
MNNIMRLAGEEAKRGMSVRPVSPLVVELLRQKIVARNVPNHAVRFLFDHLQPVETPSRKEAATRFGKYLAKATVPQLESLAGRIMGNLKGVFGESIHPDIVNRAQMPERMKFMYGEQNWYRESKVRSILDKAIAARRNGDTDMSQVPALTFKKMFNAVQPDANLPYKVSAGLRPSNEHNVSTKLQHYTRNHDTLVRLGLDPLVSVRLVPTGIFKRAGDFPYEPRVRSYKGYTGGNASLTNRGTISTPERNVFVSPNAGVASHYANKFDLPWLFEFANKHLEPTAGYETIGSFLSKRHKVIPFHGHHANNSDVSRLRRAAMEIRRSNGVMLKSPPLSANQSNSPYEGVIKSLDGVKPLNIWRGVGIRQSGNSTSPTLYNDGSSDLVYEKMKHVPIDAETMKKNILLWNMRRQAHGSKNIDGDYTVERLANPFNFSGSK